MSARHRAAAIASLIAAAAFPARPAVAQTPVGAEFQVNTYSPDNQYRPHGAVDATGAFFVAWDSMRQDGDWMGVYGRLYDPSGTPRTPEFRINAYTTGFQIFPAVGALPGGNFVVAWSQDEVGGTRIKARRYDATGAAIGAEFRVDSHVTSAATRPEIAVTAGGGFVVAWDDWAGNDGSGRGVFAQRFDASANPVGGQFQVNTYTTGHQSGVSLDAGAGGNVLMAWYSDQEASSPGVYAQVFDAAGARVGSEFLVNTYTTDWQVQPYVAAISGGFAVAWSSRFQDGSDWGVFAQRLDPLGAKLGGEFRVNTTTAGRQVGYDIAPDAGGGFVVVWEDGPGANGRRVMARSFDAGGTPLGPEFKIPAAAGYHTYPALGSNGAGNLLAMWTGPASNLEVFAQRFGGLAGTALEVDPAGNRVLEPGEVAAVRPTWRNDTGAAQALTATLGGFTGPAGATYSVVDGAGAYAIPAASASACTDCYAVTIPTPPSRPAPHWDAVALETLGAPSGSQKLWTLHVGDSFSGDVPRSSPFYRFIEMAFHNDVMGGCGAGFFCPIFNVPREHMAVFMLAAKEPTFVPPACVAGTEIFGDVPASSPYCRWIEELARRAVVGGCGNGLYCPLANISREQLAVYLLATLMGPGYGPPPCGTPMFNDVPAASPFCRWIEELARRGVVTGCGGGAYCPTLPVSREQMTVFVSVTFGLTLYGP